MSKVNWKEEAQTIATYRSSGIKNNLLLVYVYEQSNPIKCSSTHSEDYSRAIESIKSISDGDQVIFQSRGVNVYSPNDWFYKIEKVMPKEEKAKAAFVRSSYNDESFRNKERTVRRVFGPPGTGKTHYMMEIIKQRLSEGLKPREIAFVSYTNVAANEAKSRVAQHFPDYSEKDFSFFRTIHSLATIFGGDTSKKLMNSVDLLKFDKTIFSKEVWTEPGKSSSIKNREEHPCITLMSLVSARKSTVRKEHFKVEGLYAALESSYSSNQWAKNNNLSPIALAEDWIRKYNLFKSSNNYLDYDDVIRNVVSNINNKERPRFKLLIIDEAQDCSELMWDFLKELIKDTNEVIVCGDDDQAIMEDFGSSRMAFLRLETNMEDEILPTSYRLPKKIHKNLMEGAMRDLISFGIPRREKKFFPKDDAKEGNVQHVSEENLSTIVCQNTSKNWLIMSPTNATIEKFSIGLKGLGVSHYLKNMPVIVNNDEKVNDIKLQTIHTSKGAEADYVGVLVPSKTDKDSYFRYMKSKRYNPSLRYVAESRSKDQLFIVRGNIKKVKQ